jgi:hypothetical protein
MIAMTTWNVDSTKILMRSVVYRSDLGYNKLGQNYPEPEPERHLHHLNGHMFGLGPD